MLQKNFQVLACVLCIGGAQIVAASPSIAAAPAKDDVKKELPIDLFLKDTDSDSSRWQMENSYDDEAKRLTEFLKTTTDDSRVGTYRKFAAISVLSRLRATCAVDVLIKNLMFLPGVWYDSTMHSPQEYYPSAIALVEIGNTAIPALIGHISSSPSKDERQLACWVLMKIDDGGVYARADGKEFSLLRLQKTKEKGFRVEQSNLSEAIGYIQSFGPKTPFPEKTLEVKK